jgi:predicted Zn-ribbon and HTH transcriptional regulator
MSTSKRKTSYIKETVIAKDKKNERKSYQISSNWNKKQQNLKEKRIESPNKNPLLNSTKTKISIESIDYNYKKELENDNQIISSLTEKITEIKNKINQEQNKQNELKKDEIKIKKEIEIQDKEISALENQITNFQTLNSNLQSRIDSIKRRIEQRRTHNQLNENIRRRRQQAREIFENYIMSMILNSHFQRENDYPNVDNMSYEELLALEERIGNVNNGLNDDQIKKLKRDYFDKKKYNDLCIICQNNFKDKEKVLVIPCKHCFHEDCIVPWLKNKKQCPFCKSEVVV